MKKILIALLFIFPCIAAAFTATEKTAIKNAVLAEPSVQQCIIDGNDGCVADWLNSSSTFIVWKTSVTKERITNADSFDWTRVDNLTVGKARIWTEMFDNSNHAINPAKVNIRAGIDATWVGTAADLAVRAAVYVECKRPARQVERILATGTGTDATPGALTYEGAVTSSDVAQILRG